MKETTIRPCLEVQTRIRASIQVERKVAIIWQMEGCMRKTSNAFGLSPAYVSLIVRLMCRVISLYWAIEMDLHPARYSTD